MKKIITIILIAGFSAVAANADDRPIKYSDLPGAARTFIESYFPDKSVVYSSVDDDFFPDYKVVLEDGTKIDFDNSGRLEKVESENSPIPQKIIPDQICDYIRTHYPNARVEEYDVEKRHYEVKLTNDIELKFNRFFNLVEIDD